MKLNYNLDYKYNLRKGVGNNRELYLINYVYYFMSYEHFSFSINSCNRVVVPIICIGISRNKLLGYFRLSIPDPAIGGKGEFANINT